MQLYYLLVVVVVSDVSNVKVMSSTTVAVIFAVNYNYWPTTWVQITIISEPNGDFRTELSQIHSEQNPRFSKTEQKPNRNKKSILHIPRYNCWDVCCFRFQQICGQCFWQPSSRTIKPRCGTRSGLLTFTCPWEPYYETSGRRSAAPRGLAHCKNWVPCGLVYCVVATSSTRPTIVRSSYRQKCSISCRAITVVGSSRMRAILTGRVFAGLYCSFTPLSPTGYIAQC